VCACVCVHVNMHVCVCMCMCAFVCFDFNGYAFVCAQGVSLHLQKKSCKNEGFSFLTLPFTTRDVS